VIKLTNHNAGGELLFTTNSPIDQKKRNKAFMLNGFNPDLPQIQILSSHTPAKSPIDHRAITVVKRFKSSRSFF
jgi:ribonucleotide monophosphatase NagD (HAD superfamily)